MRYNIMTQEVLDEKNELVGNDTIETAIEKVTQTGELGFLTPGAGFTTPGVDYYQMLFSGEFIFAKMFYLNSVKLINASQISQDLAGKLFANLNSRRMFKAFQNGKSLSLMNLKMALDIIVYTKMERNDINSFMESAVSFIGKPEIRRDHQACEQYSKKDIGDQLAKLFEMGCNPLTDDEVGASVKTDIRSAVNGKTYPSFALFVHIMQYCGVDPISAMLNMRQLGDALSVDADYFAFEITEAPKKKALSWFIEASDLCNVSKQDKAEAFLSEIDRTVHGNNTFLPSNIRYIRERNQEIDSMIDPLIEVKSSRMAVKNILLFIKSALSFTEEQLLNEDFRVTCPLDKTKEEKPEEPVQDAVEEPEEAAVEVEPEEKVEETEVEEAEVEESEEPASKIEESAPEAEEPEVDEPAPAPKKPAAKKSAKKPAAKKAASAKKEAEPKPFKIEFKGKVYHTCDADSWENENPDPNGEGFYWSHLDADEQAQILATLPTDPEELSVAKIKAVLAETFPDQHMKLLMKIKAAACDLSFAFAV